MNCRLLIWMLLSAIAAGCRASAAPVPSAPAPVPVRVAPIVRERRAAPVRAVGTLAGKEEVRLSFKVGGIVERITVDEGALVRAGQPLAALKRVEVDAAATQAQRGFEKAERDLARVKELFDGKAATLEQLQNATTAVDVGRAALASARFNLDQAVIRAPAAGKVVRRLAERGELVGAGTPVLLLRATGRGWVLRVGLSDADVVRVALGDAAQVRFDAWPGRVFAAHVAEIAEGATPGTGTYEVELRLPPGDGPVLRSGLIGHAAIAPRPGDPLAFVPVEALQEGNGAAAAVFVTRDGRTAERRAVRIGFIDGTEVAIASGLDGVDQVITAGADRVAPGSPVELVATTEARR